MPLWLGTDANANSAPKHVIVAGSAANGAAVYANNKANANFQGTNNMAVGVFGVDITETQLTAGRKVTHAGWNIVRQGTGPVANVTISVAGTGYSNTNLWNVSNGAGGAAGAANGTIGTDASGVITSVVVVKGGNGFINVASSPLAITNATGGATGVGTGATLVPVLGGRAGRVQYECLVASGMANTANGSGAIPYVN